MEHIILVNKEQSAVITIHKTMHVSVVAYVGDTATVAYDAPSIAEAERWAKAVIAYPDNR